MGERNTSWMYSINYGPDGEENYANLVAPGGQYVSNIRTHHAVAISEGMNSLAAKDDEIRRLRDALQGLLSAPTISDEDYSDPEWGCSETDKAIEDARAALAGGSNA